MTYEPGYETPVPTIHVAPQQRNIIGYSPIYGPAPNNSPTNAAAAPNIEGNWNTRADLLFALAVWSVLVALGTWWGASSYFGGERIANLEQRHDAAMGYAQELQAQAERQQRAMDSAREALGCPVGGGL